MSRYPSAAVKILNAATSLSSGTVHQPWSEHRSFQVYGATTAGAGTAKVDIEVSNDQATWIVGGSVSLTLSTTANAGGFVMLGHWKYVRATITQIAGTGANVSVFMGTGGH